MEFGRRIGEVFGAEKVILFGSYAKGNAGPDSDVDVLVIASFEGRSVDRSVEMRMRLRPSFPVDILVRTPEKVRERIEMGDTFMGGILEQGKLLYEAASDGPERQSHGHGTVIDCTVIDAIKRYLAALPSFGIHANKAVLFGSFAKGRADQDSDIDLVVVAPEFDERRDIDMVKKLWHATLHGDIRIEPIPCGEKEWEGGWAADSGDRPAGGRGNRGGRLRFDWPCQRRHCERGEASLTTRLGKPATLRPV